MGLFDRFKKAPVQNTVKVAFEDLLRNAAHDPAYRAEFYKRLLTTDLTVITQDRELGEGTQTLEEDTSLRVVSFPDGRIPVFTSTERIFEKGVIKEQVQYVTMAGSDLLTMLRGATLLMNPYSDYGKEFLPDETDKILNGTILSEVGQSITVEKPTEVLLGQPSKIPHEMLNSLRTVLARRPEVTAAHLAWIDNAQTPDVPPHYLIGIETDDYSRDLVQEAGLTAQAFLGPNELVDFLQIKDNDGVSDYLVSVGPFYRR